ncbi:glycosyltransferase [Fulvivirgaceae bacterium BMA12]|uniref:Glycosyltransferase n=1 Tax=Agaribacillus aureus TaxID=3051825 RepID=A0ABT8L6T6_9BACT|nr:glycosyltransferase [Fulvivirgaceae bacterium BMA12]
MFLKHKGSQERDQKEPVSVVICARNELENLKVLLPKLYDQEYEDYEIIVVNDRSGDGTYDFLREEEPKNSRLEVVNIESTPDHIQEKKYALILGIKKAKNDIVLLTDADCYPNSRHWIQAMANGFKANINIVLGFSQYERKKGLLNKLIRFETLYTAIQYISAALGRSAYMGVGRNLAYRKSFFLEKNGFSGFEKVIGGDDDLFVNKNSNKNNTKVAIGADALVISYPKTKWRDFYRQKKRHLSVGKLYKGRNKTGLGILSLSHILFWFSFITLAVMSREPIWLVLGLLIRTFFLLVTFVPASKKLGDRVNFWNLILLDVVYMVYYFFTGIPVLFSKKVKWS